MENNILRSISEFEVWNQQTKTFSSTTAERLVEQNSVCRMVRLYAPESNADNIFVGARGVTANNSTIVIKPGKWANIRINNAYNVFLVAADSSDTINYTLII